MKKFSFEKFALSFVTPHPARDWAVVLSLFILLFIGVTAYAGYLFLGIRTGTIAGTSQVERPTLPNVSQADLTKTLEAFRARKADYEARNFPHPTLANPAK